MKKSQLRKIIKESIKQLMTEQSGQWNEIINWHGSGHHHIPNSNAPRCAINNNCTNGAIVGNDIYTCPNGKRVRFTTPSRYFSGVTQAYLLAQPNPYTLDLDVEVNGGTPQIGDCFCLNNKANPYTTGYCYKVVIYEIVGPVNDTCNLYGIHANMGSCNFNSNSSPYGCTNSLASNYNSTATIDDGSCILPDGCTDSSAFNHDPSAIVDDGSCDYGWSCKQLPGGGAVAEQIASMPTGCLPGTSTNVGVFPTEAFCLTQNTNIPNGCGGTNMGAKVKPIEPIDGEEKEKEREEDEYGEKERFQKLANIIKK